MATEIIEAQDLYCRTTQQVFEGKRQQARMQQRIVYDCFCATVFDDRVFCRNGKRLWISEDNSASLVRVLKGFAAEACQACEYYDNGVRKK